MMFSYYLKTYRNSWNKISKKIFCAERFNSTASDIRDIYTKGEILEMVQMSKIFEDSKTFVDKKLRYSPEIVSSNYTKLRNEWTGTSNDFLKEFLRMNFEEGNELEKWIPPDFTEIPTVIERIKCKNYQNWALKLNNIWKNLSRKISLNVKNNVNLYSLIYLPNGIIIPGGRFKELYYWDTYWIVNGLLLCDMTGTAKGTIENLLTLVDTLGYVPNGNRIYYEGRTQPPMLISMVESYYRATNDKDFLKNNIELLDKEFNYWVKNRRVEIKVKSNSHVMYHYNCTTKGPRPESFREDIMTASLEDTEEQIQERYSAIKSAAESGWDFSSRWYILRAENRGNLSNIKTNKIIPVDLNAIIHKNCNLMSQWWAEFGDDSKSIYYKAMADELLEGITKVLWKENYGIWMDYDFENETSREYYYLSNFVPLWTESYKFEKEYLADKILKYINKYQLYVYKGGIPTSLEFSDEQWDYPNAWPPLQAFLVQGLEKLGTTETKEIALYFAELWLHTMYRGFQTYDVMFEKYDVQIIGGTGEGGEYDAQEGFGWTNGIAFEFLNYWGQEIRAYDSEYMRK